MTPTERATNLVNVWADYYQLDLSPRAREELIAKVTLAIGEQLAQERAALGSLTDPVWDARDAEEPVTFPIDSPSREPEPSP